MKRKLVPAILASAVIAASMSGCATKLDNSPDLGDSEQAISTLDNANTITIERVTPAWNTTYKVKADGQPVGTIKESAFWEGSFLTYSTEAGNLVGEFDKSKGLSGTKGTITDYSGNSIGEVKQVSPNMPGITVEGTVNGADYRFEQDDPRSKQKQKFAGALTNTSAPTTPVVYYINNDKIDKITLTRGEGEKVDAVAGLWSAMTLHEIRADEKKANSK